MFNVNTFVQLYWAFLGKMFPKNYLIKYYFQGKSHFNVTCAIQGQCKAAPTKYGKLMKYTLDKANEIRYIT